jgi:hypothetical protein
MGGGGGDLHVPKGLWSPAGGFYADPKKWRRNTLVAAAAIASIAYLAFNQSIKMENRHARPHGPIVSERWYTERNFPQRP